MNTYSKRMMVTLQPEWEPILDQLKRERFYNSTRAEMLHYVISRGLQVLREEQACGQPDRKPQDSSGF